MGTDSSVNFGVAAQQLHADMPNYTDIELIIQLSGVVEI